MTSSSELLKTHSPGYAVVDLKLAGVSGLVVRADAARARPGDADRGADRLRQHRHRGRGHQARRLPLPGQAFQHRRHRGRLRQGRKAMPTWRSPSAPTSIKTLEWERIHETLAETGLQHLRNRAAARHAPAHAGAQAGEAADQVTTLLHSHNEGGDRYEHVQSCSLLAGGPFTISPVVESLRGRHEGILSNAAIRQSHE